MCAAVARKREIPHINGKDWWEHLGGTEPKIVEAGLVLHELLTNSPFQITDQDQPGVAAAKYLHASSGKEERSSDDAAANSEQTRNQNGNGYDHGNGMNGSDSNSQPDAEIHKDRPAEEAENSHSDTKPQTSLTTDDARPSPTSGTDDAPLKAAANDLSSHDQTQSSNDVSSNIDSDIKSSPKRKADEQLEEGPLPKRAKRDNSSSETLQDDQDHATRDIELDSNIEFKTAPNAAEAGLDAEEQQEEGELEQ